MVENGILHAEKLMMHRRALLDLVNQIPENQIGFSPWDGGMNFKEMVDHLVESAQWLLQIVAGEKAVKMKIASQTWTEAIERLQSNTEELNRNLATLSSQDLGREVEAFGGRKMSVAMLIDFLNAHEVHHKGQIWQMARMVGIKPPLFISMG